MLTDAEWDRLLDAVAARAAHTAALLDGELPPEVVADAAAAGVDLLPGAGEIGPRCSCPDWADPCKHAAAVVYLVAQALDADPFALLQLRGRSREEVLAGLRRRRVGPSARPHTTPVDASQVDAGVPARDAYCPDGGRPPPPAVPLPPRRPGAPAPLAVDPPPGSGLRRVDLADLAADAARRAWELCVGEGDGGLHLDPDLDLVRRAASRWGEPGNTALTELAHRAGVAPRRLARRAAAWRLGGADAVSVCDEAWAADAEAIDEARAAAVAAALGPVRARANRVTVGDGTSQLRLSRSGSWYRFERVGREWELDGGPEADPGALLIGRRELGDPTTAGAGPAGERPRAPGSN